MVSGDSPPFGAEGERFELSWRIMRQTVFETAPFSHSGTPPFAFQSFFFTELTPRDGQASLQFELLYHPPDFRINS